MREEIRAALTAAMKSRDADRTGALRLIQAAIQELDIEARGKGKPSASDEELVASLARMVRQREESARLYSENGRPELADKERAEVEIIRSFMPRQMSAEELGVAVDAAIAETRAGSPRDMGRVMAHLKERHGGAIGMGAASALLKSRLR